MFTLFKYMVLTEILNFGKQIGMAIYNGVDYVSESIAFNLGVTAPRFAEFEKVSENSEEEN